MDVYQHNTTLHIHMDMDMNTSFFLLLIASIPLILLLFVITRQRNTQSGRHPPSPPRLPIIGNLHQLSSLPHRSLRDLANKHGPVMLLILGKIPTLVVSSAEMAEQVLKTHDLDCCNRAPSHGPKIMTYNLLDIAFAPYSDYWREIRKFCTLEFLTMKKVSSFASIREFEVHRFIKCLSETSPGQVENIGEKVFSLVNNIMCKAAFGKSYEGEHFDQQKFEAVIHAAFDLLSSSWAIDFFPKFGWIMDSMKGRNSRLNKCFSDLDAFLTMVIKEHLDPTRQKLEKEDFLDLLLKLYKDSELSFPFSMDHVKAIIMDIFLGGIDSSSVTIVWAMTELMKNPRVMDKVQAEIRAFVGQKSRVEHEDMENLKYFKMMVKETLRLHPPAALLIPRECIRHCKIGDYDVYPKTMIFVNAWAIGRDTKIWERGEEFYPERFEGSEIDFRGRHFELIPFGAGKRICPALAMGTTTVEFVLANMLHCFDWELPKGMTRDDISMEEECGLTVHKKLPLLLVPIKHN